MYPLVPERIVGNPEPTIRSVEFRFARDPLCSRIRSVRGTYMLDCNPYFKLILLQLGVFPFGFLQLGKAGLGVFAESKECFVGSSCFA